MHAVSAPCPRCLTTRRAGCFYACIAYWQKRQHSWRMWFDSTGGKMRLKSLRNVTKPLLCSGSSAGKSGGLLSRWALVQVQPGTPFRRQPRRRSDPDAWADISHLWLACKRRERLFLPFLATSARVTEAMESAGGFDRLSRRMCASNPARKRAGIFYAAVAQTGQSTGVLIRRDGGSMPPGCTVVRPMRGPAR